MIHSHSHSRLSPLYHAHASHSQVSPLYLSHFSPLCLALTLTSLKLTGHGLSSDLLLIVTGHASCGLGLTISVCFLLCSQSRHLDIGLAHPSVLCFIKYLDYFSFSFAFDCNLLILFLSFVLAFDCNLLIILSVFFFFLSTSSQVLHSCSLPSNFQSI